LGAGLLAVFFAAVLFVVFFTAAFLTGDVRACATGRGIAFCAVRSCAARRVAHEEQRPSRMAFSSVATSIAPSSTVPQYVVVAKLLVCGACHSAAAGVTWWSGRTH